MTIISTFFFFITTNFDSCVTKKYRVDERNLCIKVLRQISNHSNKRDKFKKKW